MSLELVVLVLTLLSGPQAPLNVVSCVLNEKPLLMNVLLYELIARTVRERG